MDFSFIEYLPARKRKNVVAIVPRAVLEATRIATSILAKPANFAISFLAQGASLKPRSVALAVANGVIATGPGFCIYTPEGVPLTWGDAARRVRPFIRALAKAESGLYAQMGEELAFRQFKRQVPHIRAASKRLEEKKAQLRAKGAAATASRKAAIRAALEARRSCGGTNKSALRRSLKKKATKRVVTAALATVRREPTLGSIFPFSSSLFSLPPIPRDKGVSFNPPQREDFLLSPPPPLMGYAKAHFLMGPIVDLGASLGPILEAGAPGAQAALFAAIQKLPLSTFHERALFRDTQIAVSQLFVLYPSVHILGDLNSFFLQDCHGMRAALESAKRIADGISSILPQHQVVHTFLDAVKRVGSHISGAVSIVKDKVSNFTSSLFDSILDKCKSCFMSTFSPFLASLQSAKAEIEKFWQNCMSWARNLWGKAHLALQALGLYAIWALVLTILCGIVYLLESLFITAGVIGSHGIILSIFLSVVMAAAGFTIFTVGKESAQMIRTMRECILMIVIPDDAAKAIAEAEPDSQQVHSLFDCAMAPVNFLESIASGLSLFSTSSITVLGKLGNSLEGIRKGYNCLTDFISIFFEKMGGLWEGISGKQTTFFHDLTTAVKINISSWTQDARRLIEYHEMAGTLDKFEYEKVRTLIYQGEEIVDTANKGRHSYTSNQFLRVVGSLLTDLREVRAKCARSLRFDGWRRQPFWVYIFGASQCGKSTLANYLCPLLLAHMGWDAHDVYSKDPTEGYWSGYYQQKCLKMNDLSAVVPKQVSPLEQQLIPLISTEEKMVSAAEIDGKGIQFLSELAISSSNVNDAPTSCEILDPEAYRLRRKVLLRCRRAATYQHDEAGNRTEVVDAEGNIVHRQYDPSDALACTEVQWLHANSCTPVPGPAGMWHAAHSTIPLIKDAMDAHFLIEDAKREAWVQQTNMHSRTGAEVSSYLQSLVCALGSYKAIQRSSEVSDAGERKFLVAVDGTIYSINSLGIATKEAADAYDNVEALESTTLLQYRLDFAKQVREHSLLTNDGSFHSSMVRDLLEDMLVNDACVVSVDKISRDSKQLHRDLWSELKLAERIFLRVSQKALNQLRDQPHFKVDVQSVFLQHMADFRDAIVDNKQKILLFLGAILLVGVASWSFLSLMKTFLSGSVGFGSALALKNQLDIHSSVASSGSIAAQYSARSIPIVWAKAARYANVHSQIEESSHFNFFEDGLAHLLVRLVGTSGQSETAILFGSRAIALCAHQVRMFPDHDRVTVHYLDKARIAKCFPMTWHWVNAIEEKDTEVCVYRDDQLTPLPVYPDSFYLRGEIQLPSAININGVSIKKRRYYEDASLTPDERLLDGDSPIIRSWSNVAALSTSVQTISNPAPGIAYKRDLNRYLTSSYAAGVHDSGGLISILHQGRRKVVGLHVAGTRVGHLFKSTISFLPHGNFADVHSQDDFFIPEVGDREAGYEKIGFIDNPAKAPHTSTTTQLGRVPTNFEIPLPIFDEEEEENFVDAGETFEIKEPAILSKKDPRLEDPDSFDPLRTGMGKFANPMSVLDETLLEAVCEDIFTTWYDALPTVTDNQGNVSRVLLEKTSLDIALNGIPGDAYLEPMKLDTSEGYPHCVKRGPGESGKRRFVEIDDNFHFSLKPDTDVFRNYQALSGTISQQVPVLNCVECLKDECLKKRKVATPRLFDVMPFEHNILLREYFLNFSAFIQANRIYLPACIGTNVYSREWTTLYDRLAEYSDTGLNCDYSKFDGYISHQIYSWMAATINRIFRDGEEANSARRNLLLMFIGRRSICGRQVYMVRGGMPSGCAFTALINSIFNEILIRYVYRKVTPAPACNFFNKYVRLMVYGDDNLLTIKEEVIPYFDGPVIKKEMASVGIIITDGTDKSSLTLERKPLSSLEFLKRGFRVQENGLVVAPLDKTSMYTRLFYSTAGIDGVYSLDILRDNVKSFLEEIVLHPNHHREFFRVRNFYVSKVPHWGDILPTYGAAIDFHYRQQTTNTPYQTQRIFETRPHGGEHKMMAGQDCRDQTIWITNRLAIIGRNTSIPKGSQHFVVACGSSLRGGERGVTIKVETAPGMGCLPTQAWVDSFSSPKKRPSLFEAYNEGCTLYFRSEMPYYSSWCALGRFGKSQGLSTSSIIALFEEYKPTKGGDIAPLLAERTYKKFAHRPMFDFSGIKQRMSAS
ncbi:polyprotein [Peach rosette mosaic virus]|uniref:RNA1 polyprotein n=1 Tax=Peach rosette mosaic virus TaxID=65068 RepID=A0A1S6LQZ8_9SECO|nr:polyprotein [Peach rosette mosaic virus]AQT41504.1 polyprotein [Peach rosette mosaic virus]